MNKLPIHFPDGPWRILLNSAYKLLDDVEAANPGLIIPQWTLGGGTVLMFYYEHRKSKDIDIFIDYAQFLGYINPKLGGPAEDLALNYSESSEHVKLTLKDGEIDFVSSTLLTKNPFESYSVLGREIFLQTPVEIVAKKIWHRGNTATARDLLDLALVIENQYEEILNNKNFFSKNIDEFVNQCENRRDILKPVFDSIEIINFNLSYDECLSSVKNLRDEINPSPNSIQLK